LRDVDAKGKRDELLATPEDGDAAVDTERDTHP